VAGTGRAGIEHRHLRHGMAAGAPGLRRQHFEMTLL
jgi:hypothetical protein